MTLREAAAVVGVPLIVVASALAVAWAVVGVMAIIELWPA